MKTSLNISRRLCIAAIAFTILLCTHASAQTNPAALAGQWVNEAATRHLEFTANNTIYQGKLTWVQDDDKLHAGSILFDNLTWKDNQFHGNAYTARGKVKCTIVFESADKIKITATKGGFSKSVYWSRLQ